MTQATGSSGALSATAAAEQAVEKPSPELKSPVESPPSEIPQPQPATVSVDVGKSPSIDSPKPPRPIAAPPPSFAPLPKLPSPPRVDTSRDADTDEPRAKRGDSWQSKYRDSPIDRQSTCEFLGAQWVGVLEAMCEQMRAVGVQPYIEPGQIRGAIVLTLDEILPDELVITPRIASTIGTSVIITQRFLARKEIAAHVEAMRAAGEVRQEYKSPFPQQPQPQPQPQPEPPRPEPTRQAEVEHPATEFTPWEKPIV
jgi:hypothetical protein